MKGSESFTVGLVFVCRVLRGLGKAEPWDDTAMFGKRGVMYVCWCHQIPKNPDTQAERARANSKPLAMAGVVPGEIVVNAYQAEL